MRTYLQKLAVVIAISVLTAGSAYAQNQASKADSTVPFDTKGEFTIVEVMPISQYDYIKYISENIQYPLKASANNIQGVVYVNFQVGPDGIIRDVKLTKGIGSGCDEEAIRVISQMPPWTPGIQDGKPVPIRCVIPIRFRLAEGLPKPYKLTEVTKFPVSYMNLLKYVRERFEYPDSAIAKNLRGKVVISYVVGTNGRVESVNLKRGIGYGCDETLVGLVATMPPWVPAEVNGVKVAVQMEQTFLLKIKDGVGTIE